MSRLSFLLGSFYSEEEKMPKEDWEKNTIPALFSSWGTWPWGKCPECDGDGYYDYERGGATSTCESCAGTGGMLPAGRTPTGILDVACGLSLKSKFIPAGTRVGLDVHRPYLEAVETDVSWIPICADVAQLPELFLPNTFDLVLLLDIVEHLHKHEALRLIKAAEEIAKVAVVIETPEGFVPQNLDILGFEQHHLQTHRCGWKASELEDMGYQVFKRDYTMSDVKRHTEREVATEIRLLDAIKRVDQ